MGSPMQTTTRPRAPLAELPLHHFVSQSLAASPITTNEKLLKTPSRSRSRSPSPSLPRSRRSSVSVSPHKQAVLQNHRLVREGSLASPSASQAQSISDQNDNMIDAEALALPRRLFSQRPSKSGADLSLDASPIPLASASSESRFSPRNVKKFAHHSPDRPSTPKGATTTPLNLRQHRPPHTSGPKPASFVEPSPTSQRRSEPRLAGSRKDQQGDAPITPSRTRIERQASPKLTSADLTAPASTAEGVTPLEEPARVTNTILQSLPKKKHRVSRTEIAIAHEEAGAGPMASPSPRKMADYFSSTEHSIPAPASGHPRLRADSISDRQNPLATLPSLTDLSSKASVNSLTLTKSGLFLGVVARPLPGWTVFEDPVLVAHSDDTAPSQDHPVALTSEAEASPFTSPAGSPAKPVAPSTPNKENRVPDATVFASKSVPIALPDRTYSADAVPTKSCSPLRLASASPAAAASRKRGTGGRLSLLADAEEGDASKDASLPADGDETVAAVHGSGKKVKSRQNASASGSPIGMRKASSHQRKASAGSGRTSRKGSSTHYVDHTTLDAVASRTRSRTRV